MTRNHVSAAQRAAGPPILEPGDGWGYCMAAPLDDGGTPAVPSGFGWNGGAGTVWRSDLARGLTGIMFTSPRHELARAAAALRRLLGRGLRGVDRLRPAPGVVTDAPLR